MCTEDTTARLEPAVDSHVRRESRRSACIFTAFCISRGSWALFTDLELGGECSTPPPPHPPPSVRLSARPDACVMISHLAVSHRDYAFIRELVTSTSE